MTPGEDRENEGTVPPGRVASSELGARRALLDRTGFWQRVAATMVDGLAIVDASGVLIDVNSAFSRLVGFGRDELLGLLPPFPFWPSEEREAIEPAFARALEGDSAMLEVVLCRKNGERFAAVIDTFPITDECGKLECVVATMKDISVRKELERTLRASQERWRSIAENPYDFVVIIDADYKYKYVNHTAPGIVPEEVIDKATPFDFVSPAYHDTMREAFEKAFATGTATTYDTYVDVLGRWFSNIVGPIKTDGKVTALSILTRDVTDAKGAELALRQSEHRLKLAMEGAQIGIFDLDLGTGEVYYSPRLFEILGYEADSRAPLESRLASFGTHLHPDDRERTLATLSAAQSGGEPFDHEYRVVCGTGYRWVHARGRTLPGPGNSMHFSGVVTDITARKESEAERALLEAQLRQLQKMDTLGRLAAGLAHDFNNLLVPILGNAELILGEAGPNSPFRTGLEDIIHASSRARELAGRILVFGRHSDEPPRPIRVPEIVREAVRFLRASAPSGIDVVERIDDHCPEIMGIAGQIHQAINNLCTNAYQALKGRGGRIGIDVAPVDIDAAFAARHRMAAGRAVRIVVEDDGPGMAKEVLERAFEPFFTTKPAGEGSGLGLSLVHGIVTQHEGAIVTTSAPGEGARFELYFPLRGRAPSDKPGKETESTPPLSTVVRRVLCVDDDATVLRVISQVFARAGHVVTALRSAAEALERVRATADAFDVIVTDQTMPAMTGLQLAGELSSVRPELPVVVLSGYAEAALMKSAPPNVRFCLQKPLTANALLRAVERATA